MNETEQRICGCIDAHAQQLIAFAEDIYSHAELGYTEHRTAGKVADWLQSCGLDVQTGLANTGVKASLGSAAPSVCLIGELDGIRSPEHPLAVPKTGMSHACGHHMQLTALAVLPWHSVSRKLPLLSPAAPYFSPYHVRNTCR